VECEWLFLMFTETKQCFPPRQPKSCCVLIGRDRRGHWVAMDIDRKCGGLFATREAALFYALAENGNREDAIRMVSEPLELSAGFDTTSGVVADHQVNGHDS
jgi:hypothetical protein